MESENPAANPDGDEAEPGARPATPAVTPGSEIAEKVEPGEDKPSPDPGHPV